MVLDRDLKFCDSSLNLSYLNCEKISRPEVFYKISVLSNFAKFTGKRLRQNLFFNKDAGQRPSTLLKKRLWHRCFPVNFAKFLRTPYRTLLVATSETF